MSEGHRRRGTDDAPLLKNVLVLYSVAVCKTGKGTPRFSEYQAQEVGHRGRQHASCSDAERPWRRPLKKQQEVPLCSFSHAQEQLSQVPPAFDAAMRFAGQV